MNAPRRRRARPRAGKASPDALARPLRPDAVPAGITHYPSPTTAARSPARAASRLANGGVDGTGKRVTAACARCGSVREFGAAAFHVGSVALCRCARRTASATVDRSFAADVARLERNDATYRRNKVRRP